MRSALGAGDHEVVDQANCMFQPGSVAPPAPATWLSAIEKASFFPCVRRQGTRVGTGVPSGRGEQIPGKGGLNMPSPRGAPQAGEQLSLFLPLSLCVSLLCYYKGILQAA